MATEVTIPNLGYTMTAAKILKWLKSIEDPVETGEIVLEIETDKVTYGIESPANGVVKAFLVNIGDEVPVGGVVAVIGKPEEEIDLGRYQKREQREEQIPEAIQVEAQKTAPPVPVAAECRFVLASPVAKKIARERGVDLSLVKGSQDLMYSDQYVTRNFSNRLTTQGVIAFWVLAIPTALGVTAFFIWLIWFKRWQTAT